ncbi:MAG: hypothetical protein R3D63_01625 [Paracoccaceae bacterium]
MFHMANPDLMEALARVPAEGTAEARLARHRRDARKAPRARPPAGGSRRGVWPALLALWRRARPRPAA